MKEAQVLSLADEFDYLTAVKEGQAKMKPHEAVLDMKRRCDANPAAAPFDPELVNKLVELFPPK